MAKQEPLVKTHPIGQLKQYEAFVGLQVEHPAKQDTQELLTKAILA